jgi:hypothetical protein
LHGPGLAPYPVTKYDKHNQQGLALFNERNPDKTKQQGPGSRSPGGPKQKQDSTLTCIIHNRKVTDKKSSTSE